MNDETLIKRLHALGIDEESYRVIALLPLVQVAWADGQIQAAEREVILEVAAQHGFLVGDGARVLKGWLQDTPTPEYIAQGRELLVSLATNPSVGDGLHVDEVEQVVERCMDVARAAGGLFGLAFSVDAREQKAIEEIAFALQVGSESAEPET